MTIHTLLALIGRARDKKSKAGPETLSPLTTGPANRIAGRSPAGAQRSQISIAAEFLIHA